MPSSVVATTPMDSSAHSPLSRRSNRGGATPASSLLGKSSSSAPPLSTAATAGSSSHGGASFASSVGSPLASSVASSMLSSSMAGRGKKKRGAAEKKKPFTFQPSNPYEVYCYISWGIAQLGAIAGFAISDVYQVLAPSPFPLVPILITSQLCVVYGVVMFSNLAKSKFPNGQWSRWQPFHGGDNYVVLQVVGYLLLAIGLSVLFFYHHFVLAVGTRGIGGGGIARSPSSSSIPPPPAAAAAVISPLYGILTTCGLVAFIGNVALVKSLQYYTTSSSSTATTSAVGKGAGMLAGEEEGVYDEDEVELMLLKARQHNADAAGDGEEASHDNSEGEGDKGGTRKKKMSLSASIKRQMLSASSTSSSLLLEEHQRLSELSFWKRITVTSPHREILLVILLAFAASVVLACVELDNSLKSALIPLFLVLYSGCGAAVHVVIGCQHTPYYKFFMPFVGGFALTAAQICGWFTYAGIIVVGFALGRNSSVSHTPMTFLILSILSFVSIVALIGMTRLAKYPTNTVSGTHALMRYGAPLGSTMSVLGCTSIVIISYILVQGGNNNVMAMGAGRARGEGDAFALRASFAETLSIIETILAAVMLLVPITTHLIGILILDGYAPWQPFTGPSAIFIALQAFGWLFFSVAALIGFVFATSSFGSGLSVAVNASESGDAAFVDPAFALAGAAPMSAYAMPILAVISLFAQVLIHISLNVFQWPTRSPLLDKSGMLLRGDFLVTAVEAAGRKGKEVNLGSVGIGGINVEELDRNPNNTRIIGGGSSPKKVRPATTTSDALSSPNDDGSTTTTTEDSSSNVVGAGRRAAIEAALLAAGTDGETTGCEGGGGGGRHDDNDGRSVTKAYASSMSPPSPNRHERTASGNVAVREILSPNHMDVAGGGGEDSPTTYTPLISNGTFSSVQREERMAQAAAQRRQAMRNKKLLGGSVCSRDVSTSSPPRRGDLLSPINSTAATAGGESAQDLEESAYEEGGGGGDGDDDPTLAAMFEEPPRPSTDVTIDELVSTVFNGELILSCVFVGAGFIIRGLVDVLGDYLQGQRVGIALALLVIVALAAPLAQLSALSLYYKKAVEESEAQSQQRQNQQQGGFASPSRPARLNSMFSNNPSSTAHSSNLNPIRTLQSAALAKPFSGSGEYVAMQTIGWALYAIGLIFGIFRVVNAIASSGDVAGSPNSSTSLMPVWDELSQLTEGLFQLIPYAIIVGSILVERRAEAVDTKEEALYAWWVEVQRIRAEAAMYATGTSGGSMGGTQGSQFYSTTIGGGGSSYFYDLGVTGSSDFASNPRLGNTNGTHDGSGVFRGYNASRSPQQRYNVAPAAPLSPAAAAAAAESAAASVLLGMDVTLYPATLPLAPLSEVEKSYLKYMLEERGSMLSSSFPNLKAHLERMLLLGGIHHLNTSTMMQRDGGSVSSATTTPCTMSFDERSAAANTMNGVHSHQAQRFTQPNTANSSFASGGDILNRPYTATNSPARNAHSRTPSASPALGPSGGLSVGMAAPPPLFGGMGMGMQPPQSRRAPKPWATSNNNTPSMGAATTIVSHIIATDRAQMSLGSNGNLLSGSGHQQQQGGSVSPRSAGFPGFGTPSGAGPLGDMPHPISLPISSLPKPPAGTVWSPSGSGLRLVPSSQSTTAIAGGENGAANGTAGVNGNRGHRRVGSNSTGSLMMNHASNNATVVGVADVIDPETAEVFNAVATARYANAHLKQTLFAFIVTMCSVTTIIFLFSAQFSSKADRKLISLITASIGILFTAISDASLHFIFGKVYNGYGYKAYMPFNGGKSFVWLQVAGWSTLGSACVLVAMYGLEMPVAFGTLVLVAVLSVLSQVAIYTSVFAFTPAVTSRHMSLMEQHADGFVSILLFLGAVALTHVYEGFKGKQAGPVPVLFSTAALCVALPLMAISLKKSRLQAEHAQSVADSDIDAEDDDDEEDAVADEAAWEAAVAAEEAREEQNISSNLVKLYGASSSSKKKVSAGECDGANMYHEVETTMASFFPKKRSAASSGTVNGRNQSLIRTVSSMLSSVSSRMRSEHAAADMEAEAQQHHHHRSSSSPSPRRSPGDAKKRSSSPSLAAAKARRRRLRKKRERSSLIFTTFFHGVEYMLLLGVAVLPLLSIYGLYYYTHHLYHEMGWLMIATRGAFGVIAAMLIVTLLSRSFETMRQVRYRLKAFALYAQLIVIGCIVFLPVLVYPCLGTALSTFYFCIYTVTPRWFHRFVLKPIKFMAIAFVLARSGWGTMDWYNNGGLVVGDGGVSGGGGGADGASLSTGIEGGADEMVAMIRLSDAIGATGIHASGSHDSHHDDDHHHDSSSAAPVTLCPKPTPASIFMSAQQRHFGGRRRAHVGGPDGDGADGSINDGGGDGFARSVASSTMIGTLLNIIISSVGTLFAFITMCWTMVSWSAVFTTFVDLGIHVYWLWYVGARFKGEPETTGEFTVPAFQRLLESFIYRDAAKYFDIVFYRDGGNAYTGGGNASAHDAHNEGAEANSGAPMKIILPQQQQTSGSTTSRPLTAAENSLAGFDVGENMDPKSTTHDGLQKNLPKCIVGYHPHGVFAGTSLWMLGTREWRRVMQPETPLVPSDVTVHAASVIFLCPLVRDYAMAWGLRSVTLKSIENSIGQGNSPLIVTGGQAESVLSRISDTELRVVTYHLGFLRLAMRHRRPAVPVLNYGEQDLFGNVYAPKLQTWFLKRIGFGFPMLPMGWLNLPLPLRVSLRLAVGAPVYPDEGMDDPENTQHLHAFANKYFNALRVLFYKYRERCGYPNMELFFHHDKRDPLKAERQTAECATSVAMPASPKRGGKGGKHGKRQSGGGSGASAAVEAASSGHSHKKAAAALPPVSSSGAVDVPTAAIPASVTLHRVLSNTAGASSAAHRHADGGAGSVTTSPPPVAITSGRSPLLMSATTSTPPFALGNTPASTNPCTNRTTAVSSPLRDVTPPLRRPGCCGMPALGASTGSGPHSNSLFTPTASQVVSRTVSGTQHHNNGAGRSTGDHPTTAAAAAAASGSPQQSPEGAGEGVGAIAVRRHQSPVVGLAGLMGAPAAVGGGCSSRSTDVSASYAADASSSSPTLASPPTLMAGRSGLSGSTPPPSGSN